MSLRLIKLVAILVIACACPSLGTGRQEPSDSSRLRMVEMNGIDMGHFLAQLAGDDGVTIGWEVDPNKPTSQIELHLRNVTLPQIFDGIVKAEPRYQWHEEGKFIEVFPAGGSLGLLDTPIANFEVKDVSRDMAVNRLLGLPEVRAQVLAMNLQPRISLTERARAEKLSISFSGVTLRQALGRIARETDSKFWVFRKHNDGTFEIRMSCC